MKFYFHFINMTEVKRKAQVAQECLGECGVRLHLTALRLCALWTWSSALGLGAWSVSLKDPG